MKRNPFFTTIRMFLFLTLLTGIIYPLMITGIARLFFPSEANGSLVYVNDRLVGSALIGQSFGNDSNYFTSRPSFITYNPVSSGGSNFGLTNRKLKELFEQRKQQFIANNGLTCLQNIPPEMLFASGSGLDPHISPEAAMLQIKRVCRARHFSAEQEVLLRKKVRQETEPPQFLFLGSPRVNVLLLNLETDKIR